MKIKIENECQEMYIWQLCEESKKVFFSILLESRILQIMQT